MSLAPERAITGRKIQLFASRIALVARLSSAAILELKEDTGATGQAIAVLLIVGVSYGFGYSVFIGLQNQNLSPNQLISGTLANLIFTDFSVFVWSATVFLVGTKLFQGKTGYWQLARPLFFSTAPGLLFLLIAVPYRPVIVTAAVVAAAWIVVAEFVTLKNVMGFDIPRALLTSAVGLLLLIFIQMTIGGA